MSGATRRSRGLFASGSLLAAVIFAFGCSEDVTGSTDVAATEDDTTDTAANVDTGAITEDDAGSTSVDSGPATSIDIATLPTCATDTDCATTPCAGARCVDKVCIPVLKADKTPCDDGDVCTLADVCKAGQCAAGADTCGCKDDGDCAAFEDGDACNGTLGCVKASGKAFCAIDAKTEVDCQDAGKPCKPANCDAKTGKCELGSDPDGTLCDDGQPCTIDTLCKGGSCVAGGSLCGCQVTADCAAKDDGDVCNGSLFCDTSAFPYSCKTNEATVVTCPDYADTPCSKNTCDPKNGGCTVVAKPNGAPCEDGSVCTKGDTCLLDVCQPGVSTCPCIEDSDCAAKEDGDACNGTLFCNITLKTPSCQVNPATLVACPKLGDEICATTDCAPQTGKCIAKPIAENKPCDDGNPCSTGEACHKGSCDGGANTCACEADKDCASKEDGSLCNGTLYCDKSNAPFRCKVNPTTIVTCKDGDDTPCLRNTCAAKTGVCSMAAINENGPCEADGNPCTAGDSCAKGLCVASANSCQCQANADCAKFEDGNLCNGTLYCDKSAKTHVCRVNPKTVVTCPIVDDTTCAENRCDPKAGICKKTPIQQGWPCDADANLCTADDACDLGECVTGTNLCACTKDADCGAKEDGDICNGTLYCDKTAQPFVCRVNPKTVVACETASDGPCEENRCDKKKGTCTKAPLPDFGACSDGDNCTAGDVCKSGSCQPGTAICGCKSDGDCAAFEDGNACNGTLVCDKLTFPFTCKIDVATLVTCPADNETCADFVCSPGTGKCALAAAPGATNKACDDGDACTAKSVCNNGSCVGVGAVDCDDNNPCTNESCVASVGCLYVPNAAPCDDGNACTKGDTCKTNACAPGKAVSCEDGNPCTGDSCDSKTGKCLVKPIAGSCEDGNTCTLSDACKAGVCGGKARVCDDSNACTSDSCDAGKGCLFKPTSGACDDGNVCTTGDSCSGGKCLAGKTISCDDNNPCTKDFCHAAKGCVYGFASGACSDGNPCTKDDSCSGGSCKAGTNICDCKKTSDCASKEDGNACNGTLICVQDKLGIGKCSLDPKTVVTCVQDPKASCMKLVCAPKTGKCSVTQAINEGKSCDADGSVCTTADACSKGKCVAGKGLNCNDGNPCTADSCDKVKGCVAPAKTGNCNDGSACTTDDACGTGAKAGVCVPGKPRVCNDGNPCTNDACDGKKGCLTTANAAGCDDGNKCTTSDSCGGGTCNPGKAAVCNDGNICTNDACDPKTGCTTTANKLPCDDGNKCTLDDVCAVISGKASCKSGGTKNCDDGNPCTDDSCLSKTGGCVHSGNAAACNDGTVCTTGDVCGSGKCAGKAINCDDGKPCTDDSCDPKNGCVNVGNKQPCDDGDKCTVNDACTGGSCKGSGAPNCDDGEVCTDDSCAKTTGCAHTPNTSSCDDGNVCTTGDKCASGTCVSGDNSCGCVKTADCAGEEDGNKCNGTLVCDTSKAPYKCTVDAKTVVTCNAGGDTTCSVNACNTTTGGCAMKARNQGKTCDDGNKCTVSDACASGVCKSGGPANCSDNKVCTTDSCDTKTGCKNVANTAACNDGDACTTGDTCTTGLCFGGTSITCDDNKVCTADSCDTKTGCVFKATTGPCYDGNACTTNDACTAGVCKGGPPPSCNDGKVCTDDSCDTSIGCKYTSNTKACNDNNACTTNDACTGGFCSGTGMVDCDDKKPCTTDSCDSATGCKHTNSTATCDDGNACTIIDQCAGGVCTGSGSMTCDDSNACTDDSCHTTNGCVYTNNTKACDDNEPCTTNDACSGGGCTGGAPPNCSDANLCTTDYCAPGIGCESANNTASCSDGNACTLNDACNNGACSAGSPKSCDDGKVCTKDSCNSGTGVCGYTNLTGACDDGKACSAGGVCNSGAACVSLNKPRLFATTTGHADKAYGRDVIATENGFTIAGYFKGDEDLDARLVHVDRAGNVKWRKMLGVEDGGDDYGYGVARMSDGGYAVAGATKSLGPGAISVYLARTNSSGSRTWHKGIGGSSDDYGFDVAVRLDTDDIAVAGYTKSSGAGEEDAYLVITNSDGTVLHTRTYGTHEKERAEGIIVTPDGWMMVGSVEKGGAGKYDVWLAAVETDGALRWQRQVGGAGDDFGYGIAAMTGHGKMGGWVIAGTTKSTGAGEEDAWLVRVDDAGSVLWDKTFGTSKKEWLRDVAVSSAGLITAIGTFENGTGGKDDMYVVSVDGNGHQLWAKQMGGNKEEYGYGIAVAHDGGLMLVGDTLSFGDDIDQYQKRIDPWGNETCTAAGGCADKSVSDCGDGNDCTMPGCSSGSCTHTAKTGFCNDGKQCTLGAHFTRHGSAIDVVTKGTSGTDRGLGIAAVARGFICVGETPAASKPNGWLVRTDGFGNSSCAASGSCADRPSVACDDANVFTLDTCSKTGGCTHSNLANGSLCGGSKTCQVGVCK